ncbi:outer membrane beta-barrel protein [Hymenobacter sp. DG01]|uniref:outer membrane beta-barrel protein n=1 Tax=Hymenobacter sp. DG01 TaxID=2584940 RepID=UPI001123751D|nr:outer membrane beta-barrel protein [Hymenobacter sp. DG01]
MLKTYCLLALGFTLCTASTAKAQTTKGTRVLGLSAGNIIYQKNNGYRQISAQLAPSIGTFVADNVALGIALPIGYSSTKTQYSFRNTQRNLELGLLPWVRYYLPSSSKHRVFGELSVGGALSSSRTKADGYTVKNSDVTLLASLGAGYSYFITPNVGLEALAKFATNSGNSTAFGKGYLDINLGFRVYLPKGGAATVPAE